MANKSYILASLLFLAVACTTFSCKNGKSAATDQEVKFVRVDSLQRVDIYIGNLLFTSYWYADTLTKPFLYPVNTASGTTVTRGYPIFPRLGERVDHPHHIGIWFNYGDVNGIDFWNNSFAIPADKKSNYGVVQHKSIDTMYFDGNEGLLEVSARWHRLDGTNLLNEKVIYHFSGNDSTRTITRISTLTAADTTVILGDNKEGLWAIRVDKCLEMPSNEPQIFTDADGNPTTVPAVNNDCKTGMYFGSSGLKGDSVWGTRNKWVMLKGEKDQEKVSLIILDNPANPGSPAHFHARGYGLFSINNLGQQVFNPAEPKQTFSLQPGQSLQFKHRMIIVSGVEISSAEANKMYDEFSATVR
ncbi:MAG: PmoA family protein [Bacteroidales bacterium]